MFTQQSSDSTNTQPDTPPSNPGAAAQHPLVERLADAIIPDDRRVIPRYLNFIDPKRIASIVRRLEKLDGRAADAQWKAVTEKFLTRHRDVMDTFRASYRRVAEHVTRSDLDEPHRLLIGAYFTMEYSIESAALFNPSIVLHPDQSGLSAGEARFLMSLRATGEGHLSSIVFRRGVAGPAGRVRFDPPPRYAFSASPAADAPADKDEFIRKLKDAGVYEDAGKLVLESLPQPFNLDQLRSAIEDRRRQAFVADAFERATTAMLWMAHANYELRFPEDCLPAEIVIFPATESESRGMEDLRLVRFVGEEDRPTYYGTYTAFDGTRITPMLLRTDNFHDFSVRTLTGAFARNKGMALFPRKVDGSYLMVGRHDGESLYLLRSESITHWPDGEKLYEPTEPWELTQVGNCGSPIETDAGWLLLTHGVGPVREYCIGAMLLDLADPSKVIGRLRQPMLVPTGEEREGYVPNVVYSCGALRHGEKLIVPYAMSDIATKLATVNVRDLIARLQADGA